MNRWLIIHRLRGPAFVILFGITALLNQWGVLAFRRSWPLYLILAGVLLLAERAALAGNPPPISPAQPGYWRSLRRSSIIGPLLVLAAGVLALSVEMGKLNAPQVWGWYLRWWPLLLIAIGLISLGEWWLDRGSPYGRRHGYGGVVALLILLAIFAHADRRLRGLGPFDHDGNTYWMFHLWGSEHDSVRNLSQEVPPGALIDIQAPRGSVTLTPSADKQIHVQSHEVVYAGNDRDAESALEELRPQLTTNGRSVTLRSASRGNGRVDLIVAIPSDAVATIAAGRGDVTVQDLNTPLNVDAGRGDVRLNNLKAAADVRVGRGDFTAKAINGNLSLRGRLDDVSISDVDGRVLLDGDFFGDLHIARVTSQVSFHSSRAVIELDRLPGNLSRDSGDIHVDNAAGPILVTTRAKDVALTGITGDVHIEDSNGEISLGLAGQPGEIQIHNGNGDIHLAVPQDAAFLLQAIASHGDIHSDLKLPVESMGPGHSISGAVGSGGAKVELTSGHGDIRISQTDAAATSTAKESGNSTSARRLRVPQGNVPALETQ